MGNSPRKVAAPKGGSSAESASKRFRWGVGLGVPSPPGKPLLVPGEEDSDPDTVGIRWERSPSNGGTAIIGYIVEHRKMGSPNWVRSAPFLCTFPELILSGLDPGWRYQFRVKAQNAVGLSDPSELSDPLTVTLQRAVASPPRFELELKDTVALENDQIEFAVSYTGTPIPKISWFKDSFEIFSSRRTKIITENGRSNLLIHRTALDDEGEIKCTATNRAGHVSTKAKLTLEAPPRIRLPRNYEDGLLFEQDETIRLKVSLAGRPLPSVKWYHDGELMSSDTRHIFETRDGESTMKIPDARRQDRGEYSVKAINKLGEDVTSFLVTVTDRPAAPGKATVTMTLGRSVTLSWKEPDDDGGCKIGTYIIEYYRVGWNIWLKATTSRQTSTTLSELIEGSEYRFRVKAENPYGVSEPSAESDTVFIPDPKRGITSASMREKSQSHREIHRGRSEKREVSFIEPSQRTRSLTREETVSNGRPRDRASSSHRLNAPTKPPRTDSRVTFALDPVYDKDQEPIHGTALNINQAANKVAAVQNQVKVTAVEQLPTKQLSSQTTSSAIKSDSAFKPNTFSTVKTQDDTMRMTAAQVPSSTVQENPISTMDTMSSRKRAFGAIRSKSADDTDTINPMDKDSMVHGSSEFMLVLYPEEHRDVPETKKYTSPGTHDAGAKHTNVEDKYQTHQQTPGTSDDEDLVPPPMSFSLPELFSANHEIVEVIREAVSSTELLHERAMERFYRAVAAEEAANEAKIKSIQDATKISDKVSSDAPGQFEVKLRPLRRRLSNSGAQAVSWHVKRERRKSNDSQSDSNRNSLRLPSSGVLEDIASSDPNLFLNKLADTMRKYDVEGSEKMHGLSTASKGGATGEAHMKDSMKMFREERSLLLAEDNVPSEEECWREEGSDEELMDLKARILAIPVIRGDDTYHPKGKPTPHKDTPEAIPVQPTLDTYTPESFSQTDSQHQNNTSQVVPKSILKKRFETEPVPVNHFGRPIPPEVPLEKTLPKVEKPVEQPTRIIQRTVPERPVVAELRESDDYNLMKEFEKDNATVVSAAEAAKDRRKQIRQASSSSFDAEHEEQMAEERQAVVSHYTEIVKEYAMAHSPFPTRPLSRQNTPIASSPPEPQPVVREQPRLIVSRTGPSDVGPKDKTSLHLERTQSPQISKSEKVASVHPKVIIPIPVYEVLQTDTPIKTTIEMPNARSRSSYREVEPSSRASSKSRRSSSRSRRSPSRTRSTSQTRSRRSPSRTRSIPQAGTSSQVTPSRQRSSSKTRPELLDSSRRNVPLDRTDRKPSRPTSRSSSRDRSRGDFDGKAERLQKAIENKGLRSRRSSTHSTNVGTIQGAASSSNNVDNKIQIQADITVRKTLSYITDLSLLMAAMYVYLFKREIFALPIIVLLLYRHIQHEIKGWFPRWMFPARKS